MLTNSITIKKQPTQHRHTGKNQARDITRRKLRASKWPDPYIFNCRILDRKTQAEKTVPLAMHLIHEILKVIPSIPLHTYFLHGV